MATRLYEKGFRPTSFKHCMLSFAKYLSLANLS